MPYQWSMTRRFVRGKRKPYSYRKRKPKFKGRKWIRKKGRNSLFRAKFRMQLDNPGVSNLVDAFGAPLINTGDLNVKLQDFPQHAPYTRIYTQYKISKVKFEFIPTHTRDTMPGPNTTGQNVPTFVSYMYVALATTRVSVHSNRQ